MFHFIRNNVLYYIYSKLFIQRLLNNIKKTYFFSMSVSEYDQTSLGYRDFKNLYQSNGAKKKKVEWVHTSKDNLGQNYPVRTSRIEIILKPQIF